MQGSEEGKRAKLWGPCAHFGANKSMKIVERLSPTHNVWDPPRRRGGCLGWGRSRRALQTLTLFKTKNCLFCYPVKDKRPNFTPLIHFVLHKEFRGSFSINIMKLEFFFRKYIVGTSACRPRIASLRFQLEKIPCSRCKLVKLCYPENHILFGLGRIRESSVSWKKRATALSAVPLSNDISTIDVRCL